MAMQARPDRQHARAGSGALTVGEADDRAGGGRGGHWPRLRRLRGAELLGQLRLLRPPGGHVGGALLEARHRGGHGAGGQLLQQRRRLDHRHLAGLEGLRGWWAGWWSGRAGERVRARQLRRGRKLVGAGAGGQRGPSAGARRELQAAQRGAHLEGPGLRRPDVEQRAGAAAVAAGRGRRLQPRLQRLLQRGGRQGRWFRGVGSRPGGRGARRAWAGPRAGGGKARAPGTAGVRTSSTVPVPAASRSLMGAAAATACSGARAAAGAERAAGGRAAAAVLAPQSRQAGAAGLRCCQRCPQARAAARTCSLGWKNLGEGGSTSTAGTRRAGLAERTVSTGASNLASSALDACSASCGRRAGEGSRVRGSQRGGGTSPGPCIPRTAGHSQAAGGAHLRGVERLCGLGLGLA
jgi:hypothetical protein